MEEQWQSAFMTRRGLDDGVQDLRIGLMKEYLVEPVTTGFFSGSLSERKLQDFLNSKARHGWRFVRSVHESKKVMGIFSREAHFVVFERDESVAEDTVAILLRQLLRAYSIEPEA